MANHGPNFMVQTECIFKHYQCPFCSIHINVNNEKEESYDKFLRHCVENHYYAEFQKVLNTSHQCCPASGCTEQFSTLESLKIHVFEFHDSYMLEFLKEQGCPSSIRDCFIVHCYDFLAPSAF